jgi:hypothetical protein
LKLLKNFFLFLVGTGWKFEPGLGDSLGKIFANRRPPLSVKRNIISFSFFCEKITFFFIQKGAQYSRAGAAKKNCPPRATGPGRASRAISEARTHPAAPAARATPSATGSKPAARRRIARASGF